jgi:two-component system, NarL family, invasion response regulator UvrY
VQPDICEALGGAPHNKAALITTFTLETEAAAPHYALEDLPGVPRFLIVDDHAIVRRGLKQLLSEAFPEARFSEASSGRDFLASLRGDAPQLIVLDLSLPDGEGLDLLRESRAIRPGVPILVFTMHSESQFGIRALRAGASGFLSKDAEPEQLVSAVRTLLTGGRYVSRTLAEQMVTNLVSGGDRPAHELLSDREYTVLCALAAGKSPGQIAGELGISAKTISTYRRRVCIKLRLKTDADLTRFAIEHGLLP